MLVEYVKKGLVDKWGEFPIDLVTYEKTGHNDDTEFAEIIGHLKANSATRVGTLRDTQLFGRWVEGWNEKLATSGLEVVKANQAFNSLVSIKDTDELVCAMLLITRKT